MQNQDKPVNTGKEQHKSNQPMPVVGEPLDGRHYLDVVEEQQYAGKPFVKKEQDAALGEDDKSPVPPKTDH